MGGNGSWLQDGERESVVERGQRRKCAGMKQKRTLDEASNEHVCGSSKEEGKKGDLIDKKFLLEIEFFSHSSSPIEWVKTLWA